MNATDTANGAASPSAADAWNGWLAGMAAAAATAHAELRAALRDGPPVKRNPRRCYRPSCS
jgi:hypothetical protein